MRASQSCSTQPQPSGLASPPPQGGRGVEREARTSGSGAMLNQIRSLISAGNILAARELALDAVARYPDDAELRNAKRILNDGKSYRIPGSQRSTHEEFEWLRNPPECYRGKWVGLVGPEVAGSADTLQELLDALSPEVLRIKPLVVQIAPF